ncbi:MAG: hypothetical protein LBT83_02205 [Tannerella sp.]|nr:hypothetical protein [Tannerella sp.]
MINKKHTDFVIYETDDKLAKVSVRLEEETVWLTQAQLADLFLTSRPNITRHIKNILEEGELQEISVCKDFLHTAADGKNYNTKNYAVARHCGLDPQSPLFSGDSCFRRNDGVRHCGTESSSAFS